jgi:hypothetical protein
MVDRNDRQSSGTVDIITGSPCDVPQRSRHIFVNVRLRPRNGGGPIPFTQTSTGGGDVSAKDTVIGAAKQILAEIVGDGRLADEGAHQIRQASDPPIERLPAQEPATTSPSTAPRSESPHMDQSQFAFLLGRAALKVWPDLPRDAQERLFAAAVDDGVIANSLAEFLHDSHPGTAHPPRPTRIA